MATVAATATSETAGTQVPRPAVLCAIAALGVTAGALSFVLAFASDHVNEPGLQATLMVWVTLPYIFGGLIAWWRRPDSRFGILMILAGFTMFVSNLAWTDIPALHTIGQAADLLPAALLLHLFLAYPSGRLQHTFDRALVVFAYVTAFGLELVGMLLGGFGPHNLLEVTSQPHAAELLLRAQLVALSACALTGVVILARRREEWRPQRRSHLLLFDSFSLGLVMIALLFTTGAFDGPGFETIRRATLVVLGLTPIAFLSGLLGARLARSAVADLVLELRRNPAASDLRDALARALRDPSLELAYWLPQFGAYVDLEGKLVALPAPGDARRRTTLIVRDGTRVAALVHDPVLDDEPELLEAVSAAAGIALENARLHAELGARLEELQGSRARVLEAGQQERQRLERDLHDGAQQRLIALSLHLGMLESRLGDDPEARVKLEEARREIALSLEELRAVAHGIHPAVVSAHGLGVALEQLAARAAVPVRLTVELESRLPEQLEVAAYYVVSESLVNIDKHAHASVATVDVARSNGQLVVEIVDDGVGGADTERGTGLRGLADRVEALGGSLRIWTSSDAGTRVRADLPCV
jgi:signal transduction histidine kinase